MRPTHTFHIWQVGTPPYMSPELVKGQEYGTSSDVWAVGVVLFEMIALCRPFDGVNFFHIASVLTRTPTLTLTLTLTLTPPQPSFSPSP